MVSVGNLVYGRFINFEKSRKTLTFVCAGDDQVIKLSHKITTADWRRLSVCLLMIF